MSNTDEQGYDKSQIDYLKVSITLVIFSLFFGAITYLSILGYRTSTSAMNDSMMKSFETKSSQAYKVRDLEMLNSYKWINKTQGIVQIPIDRAIELTANEYAN